MDMGLLLEARAGSKALRRTQQPPGHSEFRGKATAKNKKSYGFFLSLFEATPNSWCQQTREIARKSKRNYSALSGKRNGVRYF
jgi:hypothetical protein